MDKLCELQSAHSGSPAAGPDSELATLLFSIAREFEVGILCIIHTMVFGTAMTVLFCGVLILIRGVPLYCV